MSNRLSKIKIVRKNIARTQTVYRQSQRSALKEKIITDAASKGEKAKVCLMGLGSAECSACMISSCYFMIELISV